MNIIVLFIVIFCNTFSVMATMPSIIPTAVQPTYIEVDRITNYITTEQFYAAFFEDKNVNGHSFIEFSNNIDEAQKEEIRQIFEYIASYKIGKMLLYRILVELKRTLPGLSPDTTQLRNQNKYIHLKKSKEGISYDKNKNVIKLRFDWLNTSSDFQVVRRKNRIDCEIVLERNFDEEAHPAIYLFHELLHWYHFLHDPERFSKYEDGRNSNDDLVEMNNHEIGRIYYSGLDFSHSSKEQKAISASPWMNEMDRVCDYEEMLTILGVPYNNPINIGHESLRNGDASNGYELSENAFRSNIGGLPMRFGHHNFSFYENKNVVELAENGKRFEYSETNDDYKNGIQNMKVRSGGISDEDLNTFIKNYCKEKFVGE